MTIGDVGLLLIIVPTLAFAVFCKWLYRGPRR